MPHPVKGIDHVFLLVDDLDASRDAFARLGFTVSPRGLHSAEKGSANHTIMFAHDYFELLGLVSETPGNAHHRASLARSGQGLHAIACRIDDAAEAEAQLGALGIATGERSDFARPVPLPGGGEATAAFSTLPFDPAEVPLGACFMCQHRTPETVWLPELIQHANGARGLAGILAAVDAPQSAADGFARLFAAGSVTKVDGGLKVATGPRSAPLTLLTPAALAARYPRFDLDATPIDAFAILQIEAPDQGRVRSALDASGITPVETAGGLAIGPEQASGALLEFLGS